MSVINRLPNYNDATFDFDVAINCPDVYVVNVGYNYADVSNFVNYVEAAEGKPIYLTKEIDTQIPQNINSVYNLSKQCPNSFYEGSMDYLSSIAIPFSNWNYFAHNFPYFRMRSAECSITFTDTPQYNQYGEDYNMYIYMSFYGHVVATDQIRALGDRSGSNNKIRMMWNSLDEGASSTSLSCPNLMYNYKGRYNWPIIYEPDEIDQAWVCFEFSFPYSIQGGHPISGYKYSSSINSIHISCTGYYPNVYIAQEPYK